MFVYRQFEIQAPADLRRYLCTAAALLFVALTLHGENSKGEIRVQVEDPSGAGMEASGTFAECLPPSHAPSRLALGAQSSRLDVVATTPLAGTTS